MVRNFSQGLVISLVAIALCYARGGIHVEVVLRLESSAADSVVDALQQLKMATYRSLKKFDQKYSPETYKSVLKLLENKGQVKKLVFHAGKTERYVWFLPWYEDEAKERISELQEETLRYLESTPAAGGQIRGYFEEKYPGHSQIAYLALRELVTSGRVAQMTFNTGRWVTIYFLPEKKEPLNDLLEEVEACVDRYGSVLSQDVSDSLKIEKSLALALLSALSCQGRLLKLKVGWSYLRNRPVFAYCKEGFEAQAVAKYRRLISTFRTKQRRSKILDDCLSKFKDACSNMKVDENIADLAGSYVGEAINSPWIKGRDIDTISWSAFYLASKILKQGITPGDIEIHSSVERRTLLANSKELNDVLKLNVPDLYPNPRDYLRKIVMKVKQIVELERQSAVLRIEELLKETEKFLSALPKPLVFGRRPESVAGAALYITANRLRMSEFTQRRISVSADVTEVTLRNTIKSIVTGLGGQ